MVSTCDIIIVLIYIYVANKCSIYLYKHTHTDIHIYTHTDTHSYDVIATLMIRYNLEKRAIGHFEIVIIRFKIFYPSFTNFSNYTLIRSPWVLKSENAYCFTYLSYFTRLQGYDGKWQHDMYDDIDDPRPAVKSTLYSHFLAQFEIWSDTPCLFMWL